MNGNRRKALVWSYFFLGLFVVFFLTPPVYMLITSLKTNAEISAAASSPWWIAAPTLDNYIELLTTSTYLTFFRNSALVSALVVAITMLISIPAAFALARTRPGQLTYASNPAGSGAHLIGALLKLSTRIDMVDVPYQGEVPAMIAVRRP